MAPKSEVYIAGVGLSPFSSKSSKEFLSSLVSAATKALLDAGLTYDDVDHGVTSSPGAEAFKSFDEGRIATEEVDGVSEFQMSFNWISDQRARCVLMIAVEEVRLKGRISSPSHLQASGTDQFS